MEDREEGNAVAEVKKHMTLEELCMQREGEPAPSSRLVDEAEDDTHKILSRRRGKKKQHNKKNNKKEEQEDSKRESADEEFTSTAAAQTTHADVVEETEAPRETQSLPMDAVTVRI
jgi:hypothetical protein